jgi:hypothetical protein
VISELKFGASGLLNPETTKKLGSQSGVSALTVGTITVIGDTVRINARLIATDTGRAISAAAVDIPKVAAVSELLRQPVTTGPTCAPQRTESASDQQAQPSISPTGRGPSPAAMPHEVFTVATNGFDIQDRCRRSGGSVICDLKIVNQDVTQNVSLGNEAKIYDVDSHEYTSQTVNLAGNNVTVDGRMQNSYMDYQSQAICNLIMFPTMSHKFIGWNSAYGEKSILLVLRCQFSSNILKLRGFLAHFAFL